MLCAFFNKRMRGGNVEILVKTLFGGFWEEVDAFDESTVGQSMASMSASSKQWEVPVAWVHRAREDGTARTLMLLDFRVNRLARLLAVSDCWPGNVGLHLAHWLDSHVHLVLAAERLRSGPPRDTLASSAFLRLCDWRYTPPSHTLGVREMLFRDEIPTSMFGKMYVKMIGNMALCKTLDKAVGEVGKTAEGREMMCAAFARCLLGTGPHKADMSLRKSVHAAFADGMIPFFERIGQLSTEHDFPVVFVALREFIISSALLDVSLARVLAKKHKWTSFVANAQNTGEIVRLRLRDRVGDGDLFQHKLTSSAAEKLTLSRHCKKVPGLFSRSGSKNTTLSDLCKILKRFRDRHAGRIGLGTELFTNVRDIAVRGMSSRAASEGRVSTELVRALLDDAGPEASRVFVDLVDAMVGGSEPVLKVATAHARENTNALTITDVFTESFMIACDCLEVINHIDVAFTIDLPRTYADKQRAAVCSRFTNLSEADAMCRASRILWCDGCKTVKNFVLSDSTKDLKNHTAHGYKRVSRGELGVMCYEKRRFVCCKHVPVRERTLLTKEGASCLSLFGQVYAVTTCCGHLALLQHLAPSEETPLSCVRCAARNIAKPKPATRACHYCEEVVNKPKGSYTGLFQKEDGTNTTLTFCKRHVRGFMKRDLEPLSLEDTVREIAKRIKV